MEDLYRSQFRLPHDLYELLKAAAHQEGRSVNAEVVARLQRTFAHAHNSDGDSQLAAVSERFERRLTQLEADLKRYVDERARPAGTPSKIGRRRAAK
jgi:hypothetical protein